MKYCIAERPPAAQPGAAMEEKFGDVATRLLLENDRVKVWEMRLEPGEASDLHRHGVDYLLYILEGTTIDADRPDGSSTRYPVTPGQLIFVPRGGVERAVNRSTGRFHELLIELKDGR
jgi:quercetin dioxygenase-like cupin family protein